jgi:hypothetical protein
MLDDKAPAPDDAYQGFLQDRGLLARAACEALFFVAASFVSYQAVVLLRGVRVLAQAAATGMSVAQVAAVQNASGGMWAFSEGLEELFLLCLIYLAWPVVFNLAARLRPRAASQR